MKDEENSGIVDRKELNRRFFIRLIGFFIIYLVISDFAKLYKKVDDYKENVIEKQEIASEVQEKNREINLVTEVNESFFSTSIEYLEFDNGIKIPVPNEFIGEHNIISCKKGFESNEIAHESYVVRVNYGPTVGTADVMLDIFKERIQNDYNYQRIYYFEDIDTKIFTRDETDGYFSYMIFRGTEVTFGVCYGEPKIKNT